MLSDKLILFPPSSEGGGGEGAAAPSSAEDPAGYTNKDSNKRGAGGEDYSLRASSPGALQRLGGGGGY